MKNSNKEYSFYDEATILVRAGSGGNGASTYKLGKKRQDGIPDGGDGGNGGDVTLVLDDDLNTLAGLNAGSWRPNTEVSRNKCQPFSQVDDGCTIYNHNSIGIGLVKNKHDERKNRLCNDGI